MTQSKNYKTPYQERKEARELAIYNKYIKLTEDPHNSRTKVRDALMAEFNIGSQSTFYSMIERVAERLSVQ